MLLIYVKTVIQMDDFYVFITEVSVTPSIKTV